MGKVPGEPTSETFLRVFVEPRRGLRRTEAARYVGVSPTKFDSLVGDGRMPKPKRFDGCVVWDLRKLDVAWDELDAKDQEDEINEWD